MLISKTTTKNRKSKYICDSCEKSITIEERIALFKSIGNSKAKKYDLCKDCWRKIRIIVEKHKLKKEVKDE